MRDNIVKGLCARHEDHWWRLFHSARYGSEIVPRQPKNNWGSVASLFLFWQASTSAICGICSPLPGLFTSLISPWEIPDSTPGFAKVWTRGTRNLRAELVAQSAQRHNKSALNLSDWQVDCYLSSLSKVQHYSTISSGRLVQNGNFPLNDWIGGT